MMTMNRKINDYLNELEPTLRQQGRQYYLDGCIERVFEIKPGVYRAIVLQHAIENKVTVSFQESVAVNCECQNFRVAGGCSHIAAVMYYLLEHPIEATSQFIENSIDHLVYDCDDHTAKEYLLYTLNQSQYKREFIKFLFYRIKYFNLSSEDYQYLFDYLFTLSESADRAKIMQRLYDALFERFRLKLTSHAYNEALLVLKEMIINEPSFDHDVESNLAYFEEHLSKNVVHIKSCIKYLSIYVEEFSDMEKEACYQVVLEITRNPKIYVACYSEIKNLVFDHFVKGHHEVCDSLKQLYLLLANCSDVCRQITVELIFKVIDPKDSDYPYYKAVYSALLFDRAYNPGNLNLDLLEEIKALNEDSYASDINNMARYMNEKYSQKQLLDVLVNDENWSELANNAKQYPSLRHLYVYRDALKAALGGQYATVLLEGCQEYVAKFPTGNDTLLAYIYMDEGESYFISLCEILLTYIDRKTVQKLMDEYKRVKYSMIPSQLPIHSRLEKFYSEQFNQSSH